MSRISSPPTEQMVILPEDLQRLELWISFFTNLSWRLEIIRPNDERFSHLLIRTEETLREKKQLEDEEIIGWPTKHTTGFMLRLDSSPPGSVQTIIELDDIYFFCWDDRAFGAGYFEWDGDAEEKDWAESYSLKRFTQEALSWRYICSHIIEKITKLENRVPRCDIGK